MPGTITVTVANGEVTINDPGRDKIVNYIGTSQQGPTLTPRRYGSPDAMVQDFGYSDGTLEAGHAARKNKLPFVFTRVPTDAAGTFDAIDIGGVTGTCRPSLLGSAAPLYDLQAWVKIVTGGTVGTSGIVYRDSTDGGRLESAKKALGTASSITIPSSGVTIVLDPPANALVPLAVELRADMLAHFADAVAHNAADAAAIAAITLPAPTTNAQAWAVLNQCRTAWALHLANDTAHDSVDLANGLTAPAATDAQTGITLAIELKGDANAHMDATFPADPDALLTATATTVAVQSYDDTTLDAAGIAQLDGYPNEITFTTGGGTPAHAPATVDIAGFDETGAAQTETGLVLSQIAGTVTSANKWRGTGLTITYAAGDGAGATISIGIVDSAHNSADVTNTITTADPVRGTLVADDVIEVRGYGPTWLASDLYLAIKALVDSEKDAGIVYIVGPVAGADVSQIKAGLDYAAGKGKDLVAAFGVRMPADGESDSAWLDSIIADHDAWTDQRIGWMPAYGLYEIDDGVTIRTFLKSCTPGIVRRASEIDRWVSLVRTDVGALPGVYLYENDVQVGHDENVTQGLDDVGGITLYKPTIAAFADGVYVSEQRLHKDAQDAVAVFSWARSVAAMSREVRAWGFLNIGKNLRQTGGVMDASSKAALDADLRAKLREVFGRTSANPEKENPEDVEIENLNAEEVAEVDSSVVALSPGRYQVNAIIRPKFPGAIAAMEFTIALVTG